MGLRELSDQEQASFEKATRQISKMSMYTNQQTHGWTDTHSIYISLLLPK